MTDPDPITGTLPDLPEPEGTPIYDELAEELAKEAQR